MCIQWCYRFVCKVLKLYPKSYFLAILGEALGRSCKGKDSSVFLDCSSANLYPWCHCEVGVGE